VGRGFNPRAPRAHQPKPPTKLDKKNDLIRFLTMARDSAIASVTVDELVRRHGLPPLDVQMALNEERDRRAARANAAG
jgi:hypothetical protein